MLEFLLRPLGVPLLHFSTNSSSIAGTRGELGILSSKRILNREERMKKARLFFLIVVVEIKRSMRRTTSQWSFLMKKISLD